MSSHSRRDSHSHTPPAAEEESETLIHRFGENLGMGAGLLVTDALSLVNGWNDPLLGEDGEPVQEVDGAVRVGDYDIEKRHTKVVGPQLEAYADGLEEGWFKDLVEGVGEGASDAPGALYRIEAAIAGLFD